MGKITIDKVSPYSGLGTEHQKLLAAASGYHTVEKNQVIFVEGERTNAICVLLEGEVRLVKFAPNGHEIPIRIMRPGETFAEATLFSSNRYPVTAIASSPGRYATVTHTAVMEFLEDTMFRNELLASFMERMKLLTEQIVLYSNCTLEERLFNYLLRRYGKSSTYTLDDSKKEVARNIEIAPETLSRLIKRLSNDRIITWSGHKLEVDWERYQSMSPQSGKT